MIKAGSGTIKTHDIRASFTLTRRLNLLSLWLLMVCVLAGSGYAYAATAICTDWNGQQSAVRIHLPPSVNFTPGITPDLSRPLYTSPEYRINYKCTNSGGQTRVSITRLGDFAPLKNALKGAGMQLKFRVRDSSNNNEESWNPIGADEFAPIGTSYTGTTENRTVYIIVELYLASAPKAGFYAVPSLTTFKLVPYHGSYSGFFLTTDALRIQYVPTCFVKTSLNTNKVDFGPLLTSDIDASLSRHRSFTVGASVNSNSGCNTGNLQEQYEVVTTNGNRYSFHLNLPLKVTFSVASGGAPSSDGHAIILKNINGEDNGLQLKIFDPAGHVVMFGDVLQPENHPANQLGVFDNGTFTVNKQYTATLSSTGKQVKTGKYNAQVTVKVSYY